MRRVYIGSACCGEVPVRYFMLTSGRDRYGILVEKGAERVEIPSLAGSRRRVRELLDRMLRGAVTPVTVRDVVEDWLAE